MDESAVRQQANAHADAVVAGDLRTAGADLTKEGAAKAGEVMPKLPRALDGAEVLTVQPEGDDWVAKIAYRGEGREVNVASRWTEKDGRPRIVDLEVL